MSFQKDFDQHKKENTGSNFYKFKAGENRFRIMSEPVKKVSRWGHGICYPGAVYCERDSIEEDFKQKQEEARKAGKDPKKVSRSALSTKWVVWAIDRATGQLVIVDLTNQVAEKLRNFMDSEEYGFKDFPMPYDVSVVVSGEVGTKDVKYDLVAARKNTEVTDDEMDSFSKLTPIAQIIERMQEKKKAEDEGYAETGETMRSDVGKDDKAIDPSEIPF